MWARITIGIGFHVAVLSRNARLSRPESHQERTRSRRIRGRVRVDGDTVDGSAGASAHFARQESFSDRQVINESIQAQLISFLGADDHNLENII